MFSILQVNLKLMPFRDADHLFKSPNITTAEVRIVNSRRIIKIDSDNPIEIDLSEQSINRIDILEVFERPEKQNKLLALTILWPRRTLNKEKMLALELTISVPHDFYTPIKEFLANLIMIYHWKNPGEASFPAIQMDLALRDPENKRLLLLSNGSFFGNVWFSNNLVDYENISDFLIWAFAEIKQVANGLIAACVVRKSDQLVAFEMFSELFMAYWRTTYNGTLPALKNFVDAL